MQPTTNSPSPSPTPEATPFEITNDHECCPCVADFILVEEKGGETTSSSESSDSSSSSESEDDDTTIPASPRGPFSGRGHHHAGHHRHQGPHYRHPLFLFAHRGEPGRGRGGMRGCFAPHVHPGRAHGPPPHRRAHGARHQCKEGKHGPKSSHHEAVLEKGVEDASEDIEKGDQDDSKKSRQHHCREHGRRHCSSEHAHEHRRRHHAHGPWGFGGFGGFPRPDPRAAFFMNDPRGAFHPGFGFGGPRMHHGSGGPGGFGGFGGFGMGPAAGGPFGHPHPHPHVQPGFFGAPDFDMFGGPSHDSFREHRRHTREERKHRHRQQHDEERQERHRHGRHTRFE